MRRLFSLLFLGLFTAFFAGCDFPEGVSSTAGLDNSSDDDMTLSDNDGVSDKDIVNGSDSENPEYSDSFIRGFDAGYVDYYVNDLGYSYSDTDGSEEDIYEILASHGFDTIRFRLWVDPENAVSNGIVSGDDSWSSSGLNTLERTIRQAKLAKSAGLKIMLDFHYSDYWADPGKQIIPYSWQSISTASAMAEKISVYTTSVLESMAEEEVLPDYVQVGNEIDSGLLLHTAYDASSSSLTAASSDVKGTGDNFVTYLDAACDAVRSAAPDAKIIIHVTNRKPTSVITSSISSQLDYDIVGLSYYPWESSHGTVSSLKSNIASLKAYGKEVLVTETSTYWNYGAYDSNYKDLSYAASHLIDPDTGSVYSDLTTATVTYNSSDTLIVEGTLSNQTNTVRHLMEEIYESGGSGLFWWGGDMRGEWKYSLFTYEGQAMSSIDCMNVDLEE